MIKRTTIEIDREILERAKEALGEVTIRGAVEEALRRAIASVEPERERRAVRQRRYLQSLGSRADVDVLASKEKWR